jgi:predicted RNA binding protein YcfA (HicA-like mRNA interferase family)
MKCTELLRILKRDGWYVIRQKGSHLIMEHRSKSGQVIVPFHASKEVPIGTLLTILKEADIKTNKK